MKKNTRLNLTFSLILFLLASCAPKVPTPDINQQINQIVAATLMALPTNPPPPTPPPYPTPTPFDLAGFFCEYQFCIGHPRDIAFFDLSAQKNPMAPSTFETGILAAINSSLYIQVIWQRSPGTTDPQFLLDLILISQADTRSGSLDVKLIRGMNVVYTSLNSSATVLSYGGAGAWTCGDRVFAWKAYTQQADLPAVLFEEALARFSCGQ